MTAVGGDDYKHMTSAVMAKLLPKEICLLFSVYGKKGKKAFAALTLCQVVIGKAEWDYYIDKTMLTLLLLIALYTNFMVLIFLMFLC